MPEFGGRGVHIVAKSFVHALKNTSTASMGTLPEVDNLKVLMSNFECSYIADTFLALSY
jgi:hypothetical protein